MNLRGERVLIVGDSLSARNGPEQYNVTEGTNRTASAPGDLLASYLLAQGAQAVRVNARVGRSAWNFWQREDTAKLLQADALWKPTTLVLMLGTNDIGLNLTKDADAVRQLVAAYQRMGVRQVVAIGPPAFSIPRLNDGAPAVVKMLQGVLGADYVLDARPLSLDLLGSGYRTSDNIHFTAAGAGALAPRLAQGLEQLGTAGKSAIGALKPLALGFAGVFGLGLLAVGVVLVHRRQRVGTLEGPTGRGESPQQAAAALARLNEAWGKRIWTDGYLHQDPALREQEKDAYEAESERLHAILAKDSHAQARKGKKGRRALEGAKPTPVLKLKRSGDGYYTSKVQGVDVEVTRADPPSGERAWYWRAGKEGGDDWYPSKRRATDALKAHLFGESTKLD